MRFAFPTNWRAVVGRLVSCLTVLSATAADASISIVSRDFRIHGSATCTVYYTAGGELAGWEDDWETLTETEHAEPFSDTGSAPEGLGRSAATHPILFAGASATMESFALTIEGEAVPNGVYLGKGRVVIEAEARTQFYPMGTRLTLETQGTVEYNYFDGEQDVWISLRDVTSGEELVSLRDPWDEPLHSSPLSYSWDVDPAHLYELRFGGSVDVFDAKHVSQQGTVSLTAIPEPESALMMAFSLLGWVMRGRSR
jgi:hypothetical protein